MTGIRVGEAKRPGPLFALARANPTSLYEKTKELRTLQADLFSCSETCAIALAQASTNCKEFRLKVTVPSPGNQRQL